MYILSKHSTIEFFQNGMVFNKDVYRNGKKDSYSIQKKKKEIFVVLILAMARDSACFAAVLHAVFVYDTYVRECMRYKCTHAGAAASVTWYDVADLIVESRWLYYDDEQVYVVVNMTTNACCVGKIEARMNLLSFLFVDLFLGVFVWDRKKC